MIEINRDPKNCGLNSEFKCIFLQKTKKGYECFKVGKAIEDILGCSIGAVQSPITIDPLTPHRIRYIKRSADLNDV